MNIIELSANQIITLNDYPVHSNSVLSEYFKKCQTGENIPLIPVVSKNIVRKYFDDNLLAEFERFERRNQSAEYFMLDGSHRTTALTLAKHKIIVINYESDSDIIEARELVTNGEMLQNDILNYSLEENCEILNRHFSEKPYFMTVEQKTKKMKQEKKIPSDIVDFLQ